MSLRKRLTAVTLTVLFAACSGGDEGREETGTRSAATARSDGLRDACTLLTVDEVSALTNEPVEARPGRKGQTFSKCGWFGTKSETPYVELTVYWSGGMEQWETRRSANRMAANITRTNEGVDLDSIVKPGPVAGVGDSAVYAELLPAVVLEGDVLLELTTFHLPNARQNFRPLATKLLTRI